jgi:hypothetical protein
MSLSFMMNYFLWGGEAFGFHLFQVVLHMTNVVLVFIIFKDLFEKAIDNSTDYRLLKAQKRIIPFLTALIWGIHPVNVESVAYIAAIQEVLSVFFSLLSLWLIVKGYSRAFLMAGILIFLAFLSKESAFGGGIMILFYLFLFERKKVFKWLGFLILSIGFYLWLRLGIAKISLYNYFLIVPIMNANLKERLSTIPLEVFSYLRMMFWPKVLAISQKFVVRELNLGNFWLPLVVDLLFITWLVHWGLRWRSKLYWFFWGWFFGGIFLVLNIFPLTATVAERWLYFPMIGFLGSLSLVVGEIVSKKKRLTKLSGWLVLVILMLLSARTVKRTFDWKNNLKLYSHDVQYSK